MTEESDKDPLSTGGAFSVLENLRNDSDDPLVGRTLGAYEIISLIAAGGMGRVYRARRADGSLDREVAVKVSATSGLSDELRTRFEQEQNVLAGLNHPNICQLYDAQVSKEGWPYFVMELVDGDSIVEYCQKSGFGLRKRLRLLVSVVDAVAYAHSQLVVHRDIKPANVFVNNNEDVKLLDFGIAKLLEADGALTQGAPLTPRYASPEQLLGQPITVASDISQLGLLIYEVLSGEPLNASETLAGAIQRAADGRSLKIELDMAHELPREVLSIIEHCLRADPGDRYTDANSLKKDLEAYLSGYPVSAVGQSAGYRFRKFFQRNAKPISGSIGVGVAIAAGIQTLAWLAASIPCDDPSGRLAGIWDDASRAAVTQSFLDSGLTYAPRLANRVVDVLDSYTNDWRAMHVEVCEANRVIGTQSDDMFDKRMMCLEDRLTMVSALSQRFSAADIATLENAPKALESLGSFEQCADLEHLASTVGPPPPEKAQIVAELKDRAADIQTDLSTSHVAAASSKIADVRSAAVATMYAPLIAGVELLAGQIFASESDDAANEAFVAAVTNSATARDDYLVAESWIEYVYALSQRGDEAARNHLLAAKTAVTRVGGDDYLNMRLLNVEGALAYREGNIADARDRFADALTVADRAGLPNASMLRLNLATALRELGELELSLALSQQAFDDLAEQTGPDSPLAMRAAESMVPTYNKLGDYEAANKHARQIIDVFTANLGPKHEKVANAKRSLGWSLKEMGKLEEANVLMQEALQIFQTLESPPDWTIASLHNDLGDLLMYLGDFEAAEAHLNASFDIWGRDPDSVWTQFPLTNLGFLYNRSDRNQQGLDSCSRVLALQLKSSNNEDKPEHAYALSCIGEALIGLNRSSEAIEPLRKSVELRIPHVSYELGWSRFLLARAMLLSGQEAAGKQEMKEAMQVFADHPPVDPHMAASADAWRRQGDD